LRCITALYYICIMKKITVTTTREEQREITVPHCVIDFGVFKCITGEENGLLKGVAIYRDNSVVFNSGLITAIDRTASEINYTIFRNRLLIALNEIADKFPANPEELKP
jgi:hypothetical protein